MPVHSVLTTAWHYLNSPTLSSFQSTWTSGNAFFGFQATFRAVSSSTNPPPPPLSDTARCSFQSGIQGWNTSTGGITFAQSSAQKFAGSFSPADKVPLPIRTGALADRGLSGEPEAGRAPRWGRRPRAITFISLEKERADSLDLSVGKVARRIESS